MKSMRARLFAVWGISLAAALAVGLLLLQLYHQSNDALVNRAETELNRACDEISARYSYYVSGWTGPYPEAGDPAFQHDLDDIAKLALSVRPSSGLQVTGGILRDPSDTASAGVVSQTAAAALANDDDASQRVASGSRTDLVAACALGGPVPNLAGWVTTSVEAAAGYANLRLGLGVLLALILAMSGGLAWLVTAWTLHLKGIEAGLRRHDAGGLPSIGATGEVELDRLVVALNQAGERLRLAQDDATRLAGRAAEAERLAALGRVAAGVAHEIRNPIAAMRLRAEGALAADPSRARVALGAIIGQIDRLDRLSGELLAMTQRRDMALEEIDLATFLESCAADHAAPDRHIAIEADAGTGRIDAAMLRRALDNLVQNAIRHASAGGQVTLRARHLPAAWRLEVEDSGQGVPEALRSTLFEPFVTSRADGTGLGLAIAREMVEAHGGTLVLERAGPGALFVITLPQPGTPA